MRLFQSVVCVLLLLTGDLFSQSDIDVCNLPNYGCINGSTGGSYMISNLQDNGTFYTKPGSAMPFWIGKKDVLTGLIDTSLTTNVNFGTPIGPGYLTGTMSFPGVKGYTFVNDWVFDAYGYYEIPAYVSGSKTDTIYLTVLPEFNLCEKSTSGDCQKGNGDSIFVYRNSAIVSVDAVYPITVGLTDKSSGSIDSTFSGKCELDLISGPGIFTGSKLIYGNKWIQYVDLEFNTSGEYIIGITLTDTILNNTYRASISVVVPESNSIQEKFIPRVSVFPNPASDIFHFEMEGVAKIHVFDYAGRLVLTDLVKSGYEHEVSISFLKEGAYFIKFLDENDLIIGKSTLLKIK